MESSRMDEENSVNDFKENDANRNDTLHNKSRRKTANKFRNQRNTHEDTFQSTKITTVHHILEGYDSSEILQLLPGENWLRLMTITSGLKFLADDKDDEDTQQQQQQQQEKEEEEDDHRDDIPIPSILSLQEVGTVQWPTEDCYICIDIDQDVATVKDMRNWIPSDSERSVANGPNFLLCLQKKKRHDSSFPKNTRRPSTQSCNSNMDNHMTHLQDNNNTQSLSDDDDDNNANNNNDEDEDHEDSLYHKLEELPRRQLRVLHPGDRLCTITLPAVVDSTQQGTNSEVDPTQQEKSGILGLILTYQQYCGSDNLRSPTQMSQLTMGSTLASPAVHTINTNKNNNNIHLKPKSPLTSIVIPSSIPEESPPATQDTDLQETVLEEALQKHSIQHHYDDNDQPIQDETDDDHHDNDDDDDDGQPTQALIQLATQEEKEIEKHPYFDSTVDTSPSDPRKKLDMEKEYCFTEHKREKMDSLSCKDLSKHDSFVVDSNKVIIPSPDKNDVNPNQIDFEDDDTTVMSSDNKFSGTTEVSDTAKLLEEPKQRFPLSVLKDKTIPAINVVNLGPKQKQDTKNAKKHDSIDPSDLSEMEDITMNSTSLKTKESTNLPFQPPVIQDDKEILDDPEDDLTSVPPQVSFRLVQNQPNVKSRLSNVSETIGKSDGVVEENNKTKTSVPKKPSTTSRITRGSLSKKSKQPTSGEDHTQIPGTSQCSDGTRKKRKCSQTLPNIVGIKTENLSIPYPSICDPPPPPASSSSLTTSNNRKRKANNLSKVESEALEPRRQLQLESKKNLKKNSVESADSQSTVDSIGARKRHRKEQQDIKVLITGVKFTAGHRSKLKALGGELLEKTADAHLATHVIASDGKESIRRTPKFMIAMCKTSNVVSLKWLEDSARQRKELSASPYLVLNDTVAEQLYKFDMRQALQNGDALRLQGDTLFRGKHVFVCPGVAGHRAPPEEELKLMIAAAGGRWIRSSSNLKLYHDSNTKLNEKDDSTTKSRTKTKKTKKTLKVINSTATTNATAAALIITSDPPTEEQLEQKDVRQALAAGVPHFTTSWLFQCLLCQEFKEG